MTKYIPILESANSAATAPKTCCGKNSNFKFIKPEVQGTSLCTWGVVCRELCSNYQNSLGHLKLGQSKRDKEKN